MELFNRILDDQKTLPPDLPYKELVQFVNYVLRKFFKAMEESPMLLVEAFYPKNRGQWKQFSSYVPDEKEVNMATRKVSNRFSSGFPNTSKAAGAERPYSLSFSSSFITYDWPTTCAVHLIGHLGWLVKIGTEGTRGASRCSNQRWLF